MLHHSSVQGQMCEVIRPLTFHGAEVKLSSITRVFVSTQALQQRLLLDPLHVERVVLQPPPLPPAQPAHRLHGHVLPEQPAPRPALALHLGADVPPEERHADQGAHTEGGGQERRHPCGGETRGERDEPGGGAVALCYTFFF